MEFEEIINKNLNSLNFLLYQMGSSGPNQSNLKQEFWILKKELKEKEKILKFKNWKRKYSEFRDIIVIYNSKLGRKIMISRIKKNFNDFSIVLEEKTGEKYILYKGSKAKVFKKLMLFIKEHPNG